MLEQGTNAPAFSMSDQDGNNHQLSDYKGKWVILYFYPRDMTPGCTVEACNFRDDFPAFENLDAVILGVSKDDVIRHKKFADCGLRAAPQRATRNPQHKIRRQGCIN